MARGTFTGGIHPYEGKELSKDKPIKAVLAVFKTDVLKYKKAVGAV